MYYKATGAHVTPESLFTISIRPKQRVAVVAGMQLVCPVVAKEEGGWFAVDEV